MRRLCPTCGRLVSGKCPYCRKGASRSRRTPEQERARKSASRSRYKSKAYKDACQKVLSRFDGCCAVSGKRIADKRNGKWIIRRGVGGVHHIVPIREGGTDDPSNLLPLHVSVHNRIDAELRKKAATSR